MVHIFYADVGYYSRSVPAGQFCVDRVRVVFREIVY